MHRNGVARLGNVTPGDSDSFKHANRMLAAKQRASAAVDREESGARTCAALLAILRHALLTIRQRAGGSACGHGLTVVHLKENHPLVTKSCTRALRLYCGPKVAMMLTVIPSLSLPYFGGGHSPEGTVRPDRCKGGQQGINRNIGRCRPGSPVAFAIHVLALATTACRTIGARANAGSQSLLPPAKAKAPACCAA